MIRKSWVLVALFVGLSAAMLDAASAYSLNQKGIEAMRQNRVVDAKTFFSQAILEAPNLGELYYNLGNAQSKSNEWKDAERSYAQAINRLDSHKKANAFFNLGNSFFAQDDYASAIKNYIQALRLNPKDEDAKANLELARLRQEEKKQKQESRNDKEKRNERQQEQHVRDLQSVLNVLNEKERSARQERNAQFKRQKRWVDLDW